MTPDQLRAEAEMLAARSCMERSDYLFEVAHSPTRGPEEADALAREVMRLKESREACQEISPRG